MRKVVAAVQVAARRAPDADAVEALRQRLSGSTAREHVVLDFLSDDLREARDTLDAVGAWISGAEAAIAGGDRASVLQHALGGGPLEQVEALGTVLGSLRRRLAQVAARM